MTFAELKRRRTDANDAERSGYPNKAVTPKNIIQTHKILLNNRKVKVS